MQQCTNCGHRNRAGIVFCENCGASLIGKMPVDTKSLDSDNEEQTRLAEETRQPQGEKPQGVSTFPLGSYLRLEIEGSTEPILFQPKPETIFGRRDPATGAMPDIDLTPFAGYRMGVSRRHAAIRFGDERSLDLWDLGSSNGTFLNGQRLSAHRPYRLHDGDELRLGQMVIRLFFQVAEGVQVTTPSAPAATVPLEPEDVKPAGETPKLDTEAAKPADEARPEPEKPAPEPTAPAAERPQPATTPLDGAPRPEPEKPAAPPAEAAKPAEPEPEKPSGAEPPKPETEAAKAPQPEAEKPPAAPAKADSAAPAEPEKQAAAPAKDTAAPPEPDAAKPDSPPAGQPADEAKAAPEEPKLLEDKAAPTAPKLAPGAKPAGELPKPAEADEAKPPASEPAEPPAEKPASANSSPEPVSEPEQPPESNEKHD